MNKKILALIVVFVVVLIVLLIILANRKPATPSGVVVPSGSETGQITLIWWNLFEPEANVTDLIKKYEADHEGVTIQYVQVGKEGIDTYRKEIEANLLDDDITTSPDIFPIHNSWAERFRSLTVPSPSSVFAIGDLADFYPIIKNQFSADGNVYALPLYMDAMCIIYNKALLESKGYTAPALAWSDFKIQAQKLTDIRGDEMRVAGFSAYYPSNSEFYFEVFNNLLMQNGIQMTNFEGESKIADDPNTASTINFYREFVSSGSLTWTKAMPKDIAAFLEGKLAMYPAPSWRLMDILNYNQKYNLGLKVGVANLPQLSNTSEVNYASYWGLGVSKDSQHSKEAWEFIRYMTEETQLLALNDKILENERPLGMIFPRLTLGSRNLQDEYLMPYTYALGTAASWEMYDGWLLKQEFTNSFGNNLTSQMIEGNINGVLPEPVPEED